MKLVKTRKGNIVNSKAKKFGIFSERVKLIKLSLRKSTEVRTFLQRKVERKISWVIKATFGSNKARSKG